MEAATRATLYVKKPSTAVAMTASRCTSSSSPLVAACPPQLQPLSSRARTVAASAALIDGKKIIQNHQTHQSTGRREGESALSHI